jgi:hypothetical protein
VGKAEYDYDAGEYDRIDSYAQELWTEYEDRGYTFPLFYGRMRRIQADVAYARKQYDKALNLYVEGIAQIANHGGWGMYFIDREVYVLTEKLGKLPKEEALKWVKFFKQQWEGQEPEDKFDVLVSWCDRQLVSVKLRNSA